MFERGKVSQMFDVPRWVVVDAGEVGLAEDLRVVVDAGGLYSPDPQKE